MNSFAENVNYVAGLDNLYGSGIELYKNNLSLKSVEHDIELKFSYYNNDDKKIHSIVHSETGVLVGVINDTLLSFKTLVESSITGSEFTCTVSSGVQNFVINNVVMVNINIVSNSNIYKTYELEMKVVTAGDVTYNVFGEVKDSLKILPSLAMITASDIDAMVNVYEIQEEVITVSENIANVTTVSDSIANVNTVVANITNVNIVGDDIANVNTVASNIVGLNSIVSNMTEILLADDNAAIATTKALESSDSAAASLQSSLDSAASAALFPNHIADTTNPHEVTKIQVGLEFAENTADIDKIVASAGKLTSAVNISLSGDASGSVSFDGSANVDVVVTVGNDTHTHAFGNITGKPDTLAGYGITDADTSAQVTTKINNAVAALVDASPTTLDTLNELAAALGDDPNFATTTSTALGNRVVKNADIVAGTGTKITYDAKGLVTSSTTPTTLAGYSIGDAYTKAEADALHDSLAVASAGQSVSYFLDNVIKPGGNYALTNSPDGDPETTIQKIAVAANTPYFMERYISDPIGGTTIDGGLWVFRTYASVSGDAGTSEIISRVNKRTIKSGTVTITGTGTSRTITSSDPIFVLEDANSSILNATLIETPTETFWISAFTSATQVTATTDNSGYINETSASIYMYYKLFEATTGNISGNTAKLYETKSIQPSFNIVPTDSILIAYFAITTSTNKTLTLYKGGTVNYSHIVTPIVYRHNSLKGLNEGEFQHLTAAQLAKINAISGTNTGDQDLSGKADVATTLLGYGILDSYTKTEVQTILPKVGFDTTNVVVPGIGQVAWNQDENTLDLGLNGAVLQVGQEHLIRVRNNTVSTITNGSAVMATGTIGNSGRITIGNANLTQANAKYILGIVTENIISGADGFVTAFGKVRGIQTNGGQFGETWVDGDVIYVKDSGNGALTNVVPTDTQVKLPIAIVVHAHGSNGTLFVRVNSIDENHAKAELVLKADKSDTYTKGQVDTALALKVDKVAGKGLSTEDYTSIEKSKLNGIAENANNYSLPVATDTVLGGVKAGANVSIDAAGVISASASGGADARIEKFIENPDSTSGIITVPKVIASGETITIPAGRVAVLPNVQIDGVLNVEGEVFIPSGATLGDLDAQLALKAPLVNPAFTNPTATTQAAQDNSTKVATTAYVDGKMVLGTAVNSTSGTSIDFTGIPSWVKKVTVIFNGVSTNGASAILVQLGYSGGVENSGYIGRGCFLQGAGGITVVDATTGLYISAANGASEIYRTITTFVKLSNNTYVGTSLSSTNGSNGMAQGACSKTLSGTLDRIRITTVNGIDTFDAGQINIMYEG